MEKTPRYTQRERNMVLGYAAQYKDVIENKRTDAESNRKKDEVWRQIAKEFNARVYHQRSSKQLRQLYKNMKLLLKKDLCGEGKGNRSFMDLLNTLSQQESVAQYISEQMSPSGFSNSRQQKFDDEYDDSKIPNFGFDRADTDVIVIKSEDFSDNEQSQNHGVHYNKMEDDDDDCLSSKDIPEVCLEEEDDEIFATDLRQQLSYNNQKHYSQSQQQQKEQSQDQHQQHSDINIQSFGGIRVGSIGRLSNHKSVQKENNVLLNISSSSSNNNNNNNSNNNNNNNSNGNNNNNINNNKDNNGCCNNNIPKLSPEQVQQHLLLNGLGLSAVHPIESLSPSISRVQQQRSTQNSNSENTRNSSMINLSNNNYEMKTPELENPSRMSINNNHINNILNRNQNDNRNDYLLSLAIEERRRKIDLLNAQIEYWKTLTMKLDTNINIEQNPTPTCACNFPGKMNGMQTNSNNS